LGSAGVTCITTRLSALNGNREGAARTGSEAGVEVEYSGRCELSLNGEAFVTGTAHFLVRGDTSIGGWYGFVESPTFEWDAVPPRQAVKVRLPSGSVHHIAIDSYIPGALVVVRVEGSGPPPW
jgi:hypothetical protein